MNCFVCNMAHSKCIDLAVEFSDVTFRHEVKIFTHKCRILSIRNLNRRVFRLEVVMEEFLALYFFDAVNF